MQPAPSSTATAHPARPGVLLVDDTPSNLVALHAVLEVLDVRMVDARSGAEALEQIEQEPFAVVLLDVQMPGMDGFETARRMRALPAGREVPIVFLTAIHRDEGYARRGYATGAADYITKPFDAEVLRARVRAFVDLYRQREEAHRARWEARTRELDETQRRLAAFERISTSALETDDLHAFLHTLLTIFLGAADSATTATILLRHGDGLVTAASIGMPEDVQSHREVKVGDGFAGGIAATGRPMLLTGEAIARTMVSPWVPSLGLCAIYGVPLITDGDVMGVAHIGATQAEGFAPREMRLFQAMADRAAWVVARKRSRNRLYAVLDAAPAAIAVWRAPDFRCEYANHAHRALFPSRQIAGASPMELGAPATLSPHLSRVGSTGETVQLEEMAWSADWGNGHPEERFFRVTCSLLRDDLGQGEAILSVAVDVTVHVEARRALEAIERERAVLLENERAARTEAEAANRTKDEFLATVSHEMRTPLNAILGWTASARRGVVTDIDRALGIIERNARTQARIIEDVLDLSRIVSGKLRLDIVSTDISQALFGAVEAVRPSADAKGVALEVDVDGSLGMLSVDADRIQQIVWNLLTNGVKFTDQGGRVRLAASRPGGRVELSVEDTGQGIAADFLPHVFKPFRQADGSTTRRHGGLGLGLAIVSTLVQAHGGAVRAESAGPGKGARFIVDLPGRTVPVFASPPIEERLAHPAVQLHATRVLVVDDEEDSRSLLGEVLVSQGAVVDQAASAAEALTSIATFHPDILVSDIGMPSVDGYGLIRTIRRLPQEAGGSIPAIALTAYARSEDRRRAHTEGFQKHLAKPVDPSELVACVAEIARSMREAARPSEPPSPPRRSVL